MWPFITSLTKVLVVFATIAAGLMAITHHAAAEELNFAAIEGRHATVASMPAAALDFSAIAGSPTPWAINAAALNFDVLADQPITAPIEPPTARPREKRKLICWGDCKTCAPCFRLKKEWDDLPASLKEKLDYELVFPEGKPLPSWVKFLPSIEWETDEGPRCMNFDMHKVKGSMLNTIDTHFHATELEVKGAKREKVIGRFRGWHRRQAERIHDIVEAKLQEDPNISEEALREHVKTSLGLPPGLLALLLPIINYILQLLLNRPSPPAPAMHNPIFWGMPAYT